MEWRNVTPTLPTLTPFNSPTVQHTLPLSSLPSPSSWPFLSTPASSIPPFRSAAGLLLTPSPVGASKLTRSLTQLTSQTLSSRSTVAGLASCLRRVALFLRRNLCSCLRRQFCSCLRRQLCSSRSSLPIQLVRWSLLGYLDLPPIVHGPEQQYCFLLAPPMGMNKRPARSNLYEICAANHWRPPLFECYKQDGPCHQIMFTFKVTIEIEDASRNIIECYGAPRRKKKTAADDAAEGALWYLKNIGYEMKNQ
ncbi:uncharacterized protein LOC107468220 [Arachis duranensis]|uniref:Uncharacterized protein LOC107468220 n=1 Tax=Arachis duranensis TaxID=130453 RepID=A0A6P4BTR1_ARADU|nr:uncharacterized protein LOC107468220 [Arachis duranensis]